MDPPLRESDADGGGGEDNGSEEEEGGNLVPMVPVVSAVARDQLYKNRSSGKTDSQ